MPQFKLNDKVQMTQPSQFCCSEEELALQNELEESLSQYHQAIAEVGRFVVWLQQLRTQLREEIGWPLIASATEPVDGSDIQSGDRLASTQMHPCEVNTGGA